MKDLRDVLSTCTSQCLFTVLLLNFEMLVVLVISGRTINFMIKGICDNVHKLNSHFCGIQVAVDWMLMGWMQLSKSNLVSHLHQWWPHSAFMETYYSWYLCVKRACVQLYNKRQFHTDQYTKFPPSPIRPNLILCNDKKKVAVRKSSLFLF